MRKPWMMLCARFLVLFLLVLGTSCSLDKQKEYVVVTVTNTRTEGILISWGFLSNGIEVPSQSSRSVSVEKGQQLLARDKATGTVLNARSFYTDFQTWTL